MKILQLFTPNDENVIYHMFLMIVPQFSKPLCERKVDEFVGQIQPLHTVPLLDVIRFHRQEDHILYMLHEKMEKVYC